MPPTPAQAFSYLPSPAMTHAFFKVQFKCYFCQVFPEKSVLLPYSPIILNTSYCTIYACALLHRYIIHHALSSHSSLYESSYSPFL